MTPAEIHPAPRRPAPPPHIRNAETGVGDAPNTCNTHGSRDAVAGGTS